MVTCMSVRSPTASAIHTTPSRWDWSVGFYPGSHPGEHQSDTAARFDEARAELEAASAVFPSNRTEADFQQWREDDAWTAWKYRMWDTRNQLPTQLPGGRSKCFCGAGLTIAGMAEHVRSTERPGRIKFKEDRRSLLRGRRSGARVACPAPIGRLPDIHPGRDEHARISDH
jgi:hypothetical protein